MYSVIWGREILHTYLPDPSDPYSQSHDSLRIFSFAFSLLQSRGSNFGAHSRDFDRGMLLMGSVDLCHPPGLLRVIMDA